MTKTTLKIDGMMCGMCESHMTSSHTAGESVIISEEPLDEAKLAEVVGETGYTLEGISSEPYTKGGLFSFLKK